MNVDIYSRYRQYTYIQRETYIYRERDYLYIYIYYCLVVPSPNHLVASKVDLRKQSIRTMTFSGTDFKAFPEFRIIFVSISYLGGVPRVFSLPSWPGGPTLHLSGAPGWGVSRSAWFGSPIWRPVASSRREWNTPPNNEANPIQK